MAISGQYLNAITENASRLGMRLQESISEHTRDLRASSNVYLDTNDDRSRDLRKQLDSNSDREKLDAMKRLIALISKGRNVSEYFPQVVKNVASQNLEIRKLVYIYILRYAEQEPDLALLSINTFQRDLTDSNPLIRAMALRVLSGIKVPSIGSLVVLAIKKCAADVSPYVRKAAALAIPKCYELDSSHLPELISVITNLLRDRSPLSIGSVIVAFEAVCSTRLDLLHQQYRRFCKILLDVDEWGQVGLLNVLLRYARTMLPRPPAKAEKEKMDKDLQLLLLSAEPLFQSRNPAVVLAVCRVYVYAATSSHLSTIVQPLLRLLHTSKEVERVVLVYLLIISRAAPFLFVPYYTRFLVRTDDLRQVKQDKIKLLLTVLTVDTYPAILREFIDYANDREDLVVTDAIQAIGQCARLIPDSTQQCLAALTGMIKSSNDVVVGSSVLVLKLLLQKQLSGPSGASSFSQSPLNIIAQLARRIDDIAHAQARACVIWLVGQYSGTVANVADPEGVVDWAPDVLRKTAKSFGQEPSVVKLQIVTLAAKIAVLCPLHQRLALLSQYVFSLARYDENYDVRDRARMVSSLLAGLNPPVNDTGNGPRVGVVLRREQVKMVLFDGKANFVEDAGHSSDDKAMVGSLQAITGRSMQMDLILPDWLEKGVESSLRDAEEDATPTIVAPVALSSAQWARGIASPVVLTPGGGSSPVESSKNGTQKGPWMDLDAFYADPEEQAKAASAGEEDELEDEETSDEEESSVGEETDDHATDSAGLEDGGKELDGHENENDEREIRINR